MNYEHQVLWRVRNFRARKKKQFSQIKRRHFVERKTLYKMAISISIFFLNPLRPSKFSNLPSDNNAGHAVEITAPNDNRRLRQHQPRPDTSGKYITTTKDMHNHANLHINNKKKLVCPAQFLAAGHNDNVRADFEAGRRNAATMCKSTRPP